MAGKSKSSKSAANENQSWETRHKYLYRPLPLIVSVENISHDIQVRTFKTATEMLTHMWLSNETSPEYIPDNRYAKSSINSENANVTLVELAWGPHILLMASHKLYDR